MPTHHVASVAANHTHSWRLTFMARPGGVELLKASRVAMRAPAPSTPPPHDGQTGFWVELRDGDGDLLHHRALRDPLPDSLEVFDDEAGGSIRRTPTARSEAKFDVIVPDMPSASEVVLHSVPAGTGTRDKRVPTTRFSMEELRAHRAGPAARQ